ncbi:hypothetical protein [Bacillus cereus]|nr:hypothetical protein [Bacillus cereus]EOO44248.1 hypothetical protein ICK_06505 [Bacillus cereus BAG1X2-2]EOP00353.1 hypothetical protein ICO_06309 [Bacillus cereus BAG2O-1]
MFSLLVLIALFISLLVGVWYALGKLNVFEKVGNFILNLTNLFNEKE